MPPTYTKFKRKLQCINRIVITKHWSVANHKLTVHCVPSTYFCFRFFFLHRNEEKNGILSLEVCFVFVFEHLSSFPLVFLLKFDINSSNLYFWLHYERYYHVDLNVFIFPGNGSHS